MLMEEKESLEMLEGLDPLPQQSLHLLRDMAASRLLIHKCDPPKV
jgi:hypothetical protein